MASEAFGTRNPEELYAQLRPDQRTVIAGEFLRLLTIAGDPQAERLRRETEAAQENMPREAPTNVPENADEQPTDDGAVRMPASRPEYNPARVTAAQVSRLHSYTREHHPDLFEQVMHHPVTEAVMAAPGAGVAEHESGAQPQMQTEEPLREQPLPDQPEDALTEPALAQRASGTADGIEPDRLMRTPNERGARPFEDEGGDTLIRPEPVEPEEPAEP